MGAFENLPLTSPFWTKKIVKKPTSNIPDDKIEYRERICEACVHFHKTLSETEETTTYEKFQTMLRLNEEVRGSREEELVIGSRVMVDAFVAYRLPFTIQRENATMEKLKAACVDEFPTIVKEHFEDDFDFVDK